MIGVLTRGFNLVVARSILLVVAFSIAYPATASTPSQLPLEAISHVDPNLMLLLDDSASMNNIVVDEPYKAGDSLWKNCSKPVSEGVSVYLSVSRDTGLAGFRTDADAGAAVIDWSSSGDLPSCFDPALRYSAKLFADSSNADHRYSHGGGYLPAMYSGHYLNWYFANGDGDGPALFGTDSRQRPGTERRIEVARSAALSLVDSLDAIRIGMASYDQDVGAYIRVPVGEISSRREQLKAQLNALSPFGSTPLAKAFSALGRYFISGYDSQPLRVHPAAEPPGALVAGDDLFPSPPKFAASIDAADRRSPIEYSCQRSFIVALTDGRPQSDQSVSSYLEDYDGDCSDNRCANYDKKPDRSYESRGSDYLDDVAEALHDIDLRPDLLDLQGRPTKNSLTTYMIGFADTEAQRDPLIYDAAVQGGGLFIAADNAKDLAQALQKAANSVLDKAGTGASVGFNSAQLEYGSALYQSYYDTQRWGGRLRRFALEENGKRGASSWDAAQLLDQQDPNERSILTWDGKRGVPFRWDWLSGVQRSDLLVGTGGAAGDSIARARLDYLRGDRQHEGTGHGFRRRSSRLGDLVHSAPVYVAEAELNLSSDEVVTNLLGVTGKRYRTFRKGDSATRKPMIYVGANDGMLHGFDAESGEERLAYVPASLFTSAPKGGLHYLTEPGYQHRFYVDLTPTVADAFLSTTTGSAWHSVLVGGLGAGGKGMFALDVTDPAKFQESNSDQVVMWEFSAEDDAAMGYSYSRPLVALLNDGRWAVITGNGYGADTGEAALLILYLDGGKNGTWRLNLDYRRMDLPAQGGGNGLSTPAGVDLDGNGTVDRVYAGDLKGNVWAFELKSADPRQWGAAYSSSAAPSPLFRTRSGDAFQPITSEPLILKHDPQGNSQTSDPGLQIIVGTGQFFAESDMHSSGVQSLYSVLDLGAGNLDRSHLRPLLLESRQGVRTIAPAGNSKGGGKGWFIDLPQTGERMIETPQVRGNSLYFNTLVPDGRPCAQGGNGWMMAVNARDGLAGSLPTMDLNGDGKLDNQDLAEGVVPVGSWFGEGLLVRSGYIEDLQFTAVSDGGLLERRIRGGVAYPTGRLSWQELISGE